MTKVKLNSILKNMLKEKKDNEIVIDNFKITTCKRNNYNCYFIHEINSSDRYFYDHHNRKNFIKYVIEKINRSVEK